MTTNRLRILGAIVLLTGVTGAASAQSANRTLPGVPTRPATTVKKLAAEPVDVTRCRTHCAASSASVGHRNDRHESVAELQARQNFCFNRMS